MKNKRRLSGILGLFLILWGCTSFSPEERSEQESEIAITLENTEGEDTEEKSDLSRGDLFTMFEEVNNETVIDFLYEDYNKDGRHEAFVITGQEEYKLWYMSADGCEIVKEHFTEEKVPETEVLSYKTKDYLLLTGDEDGRRSTLVYSVDNDARVLEADISGKGYFYKNQDEMLFEVDGTRDGVDFVSRYYLYYTYDEGFKEYGAIPISQEQFLEFEGARKILDDLEEEYPDCELNCSFLYRSNYYIDINIVIKSEDRQENKCLTVKYDTYGVKLVRMEDGRVETAYFLEIATFPTAFKHPIQSVKE